MQYTLYHLPVSHLLETCYERLHHAQQQVNSIPSNEPTATQIDLNWFDADNLDTNITFSSQHHRTPRNRVTIYSWLARNNTSTKVEFYIVHHDAHKWHRFIYFLGLIAFSIGISIEPLLG